MNGLKTSLVLNAVDERLTSHILDLATGALAPGHSITLPAKLQYAWRHPDKPILYAACSAAGPRVVSDHNVVISLRLAPDGTMIPFGDEILLPRRAVHICTDPKSRFLLAAHNFGGGGVSVLPIMKDGSLGPIIAQDQPCDFGIYPHQLRVFPSGQSLLVVDRGINPTADQPELPGALRRYQLSASGQLRQAEVLAPNGGYGYGPRHGDFHPNGPWLYVVDERFNRFSAYHIAGDRLEAAPRYEMDLLQAPGDLQPRQLGGAVHVHPKGHVVYACNRADHTTEVEGEMVFAGGENSIVVYAIDPATGAPTALQHAALETTHARTFAVDPTGQILVAASNKPIARRVAGQIKPTPAQLVIFKIAPDGTLARIHAQDCPTAPGALQYWCGIVAI